MKRYKNLYNKIIDIESCKQAILEASKSKRERKFVKEVLENIDVYAKDLSSKLQDLEFCTKYHERIILNKASNKERILQISNFYPDLCAQHAIVQVLKPLITKRSYFWSCANIPQRGIKHAEVGTTRATLHDLKHAKYCAKLDIQKFYGSIDRQVLKATLRHKIKDYKALELISAVIDSYKGDGLPIGNYLSPWLAEFLLQSLDYFIKQTLHIRHYIRYADDMVLIDSNKRKLHKAVDAISSYLAKLKLKLKHNYQVFLIKRSRGETRAGKGRKIDFVGKCFARGYTTVRKRRALAFMRQSRKIQKLQSTNKPISYKQAAGFISRASCLKHANTIALKAKYYDTININQLKEIIRNESKRQCIT